MIVLPLTKEREGNVDDSPAFSLSLSLSLSLSYRGARIVSRRGGTIGNAVFTHPAVANVVATSFHQLLRVPPS